MTASAEQLVEAAKNGDITTVKIIMASDPSKRNALDEEKYTLLHLWAYVRGHWKAVRHLVEHGVDTLLTPPDIIVFSVIVLKKWG